MRKFQPKVKVTGQPRNKLPIARPITSDADCSISCCEAPSLQAPMVLDEGLASVASVFNASSSAPINSNPDLLVSEEVLNSRETVASDSHGVSWMDDGRLEREVKFYFLAYHFFVSFRYKF